MQASSFPRCFQTSLGYPSVSLLCRCDTTKTGKNPLNTRTDQGRRPRTPFLPSVPQGVAWEGQPPRGSLHEAPIAGVRVRAEPRPPRRRPRVHHARPASTSRLITLAKQTRPPARPHPPAQTRRRVADAAVGTKGTVLAMPRQERSLPSAHSSASYKGESVGTVPPPPDGRVNYRDKDMGCLGPARRGATAMDQQCLGALRSNVNCAVASPARRGRKPPGNMRSPVTRH